jgi:hypothetical protein
MRWRVGGLPERGHSATLGYTASPFREHLRPAELRRRRHGPLVLTAIITLFTLLRAVCGRADHALRWWCGLGPDAPERDVLAPMLARTSFRGTPVACARRTH